MNKNFRYLAIAGGIIVLIALIVVYQKSHTNNIIQPPSKEFLALGDNNKSRTQLDVPENVSVPEQNQQTSQDVAVPVNVVPASPQSNTSLRNVTKSGQ